MNRTHTANPGPPDTHAMSLKMKGGDRDAIRQLWAHSCKIVQLCTNIWRTRLPLTILHHTSTHQVAPQARQPFSSDGHLVCGQTLFLPQRVHDYSRCVVEARARQT